MRAARHCLAVAMSALFAFAPMVPAQAITMPVVKQQPVETSNQGNVETVQYRKKRIIIRRNRAVRNREVRRHRVVRRSRGDINVGNGVPGGERRYNRSRGFYTPNRDSYRYGWYRGYRGYRYERPGYRYYNGYWFPLGAFAAGAIIGGAIANDRPVYSYSGGSSHTNWCYNRYRSYRAWDNTFQPYEGPRRQCISPYS
ncbi:BA14K family protein [Rhizobium sp. TRM95111]|uniref:BA14K family protein n=1 Tax=Rhizobium alarense TaxID=2846851 RepID=UPI001F1A8D79|nr:BA14K family protein [Rhizobium alarense]MCF3640639.1 BA14K family protein [Rhizobium alarense]